LQSPDGRHAKFDPTHKLLPSAHNSQQTGEGSEGGGWIGN
jgi:hypothetical protein